MPRDLAHLPVHEIRRRYVEGGAAVSPQLLNKLRRDPRQGVRRLVEVLKKRQEKEREEQLRLEALLHFERVLWRTGRTRVAGVDEAGVGPLAGPVVAAAVVFPPQVSIAGMDDSKRLDPATREELAGEIRKRAAGVGVGMAEVEEIDRINIYQAALLAMRRAVEALPEPPQHVLVDAREIPDLPIPQNPFNKGDGLNFSIAAASVIAKTHRDRLMAELDRRFPGYGFARHKGYGTAEHQEAIRRRGPCPVHRRSFGFIEELCGGYSALFYRLKGRFEEAAGHREQLAAFEVELEARRGELAEREHKKLSLLVARRWKVL